MVARLGKLLKSAGKIAKQLRSSEPIVAKNGQALTKGEKLVNTVFNVADKAAAPVLIGSVGVTGASLIPIIYGATTGNEDLVKKGFFGLSKGVDTFFGGVLGCLAGGPLGCVLGAYLAYSTDYSFLGSLPATEGYLTIEDCHTEMAEARQETYDSIKELFGFNTTEKVLTEEENPIETFCKELKNLFNNGKIGDMVEFPSIQGLTAEIDVAGQKVTIEPEDIILKTEDEIIIVKANTQTHDKIKAKKTFEQEFDNLIKNGKVGDSIIAPNIEYLTFTLEGEGEKVTIEPNDTIIKLEKGLQIVKSKKASETTTDVVSALEAGKENIAEEDCKITDHAGTVHNIKKGDTYIFDENGILTVIPKNSTVSFRRLGKGAQPLEMTVGEKHVAEENMKFLVGKNNRLVSVEQGDTLVCKSDSTLDVRPFQAPKISIRKIGSPQPVEYEVGKTYTAENDTKLIVGKKNELVTIKAGESFICNPDSTITVMN